jgi:hypothetical protein
MRRVVPCAIEDLAAADHGDRSSTCRTRYRWERSGVGPARSQSEPRDPLGAQQPLSPSIRSFRLSEVSVPDTESRWCACDIFTWL